mmetsp:Transcript_88741/g.153629  ORF Transcript_88741/g.153629 Transcript_88741/m.153629 type:complete len:221 (+) Transcript_88741:55-717(+)
MGAVCPADRLCCAEDAEDKQVTRSLGLAPPMKEVTLADLQTKLPADRSPASSAKRKQLFRQADANGNGLLSLAEIDKLVRDTLNIGDIGPSGLAPVMMRSYQVARDYGSGVDMTKVTGMDAAMQLDEADIDAATVDPKEFRILLEYMQKYFILFKKFQTIDADFDGRLDEDEWEAAQASGTVPLSVTFAEVDVNGGGILLFDEFSAALIAKGGLDIGPEY